MRSFSELKNSKYMTLIMLYLGFCIAYIDRTAINFSLTAIGADFHLSTSELGVVMSAFFVGYTIMQLPGGVLADRFGSKKIILISMSFWSLFTILTGTTYTLVGLLVIRFLFGIGEGSFPPATFKGVAEAFPVNQRGKMAGVLASSNYVGSALAPLIVVPIMLLTGGWRNMFHFLGIIGGVFILAYWLLVQSKFSPGMTVAQRKSYNFRDVIHLSLLWKLLFAWFFLSVINKGLASWMPAYLLTERGLDSKSVGLLMPLPFVAAGISTAISGYVMEHYFNKREKYMLAGCALLTAFFLYFMYTSTTIAEVMTFQCIVYFFKSFVLGIVMALPLKLLPQTIAGSAVGLINLGGQAAGFIAPAAMGFIISAAGGNYNPVFIFLIISACLSALCSLSITNKDKKVEVNI